MTLHPNVLTALFAHEVLRKIGIPSDSIFVNLTGVGRLAVTVKKNDRDWTWDLGELSMSPGEFREKWAEAVRHWNLSSQEELAKLDFDSSPQRLQAVDVISSLVLKGMLP